MNKRIKKKKAKMSGFHLGDRVYTSEYIDYLMRRGVLRDYLIPRWKTVFKSDIIKLHKTNMKRALNQCVKDMRRTSYPPYKHLRFARHLEVKEEFRYPKSIPHILGGEHIEYAAATFVPIKGTSNSCEAASMEVD
jgi:hypothetical protein